MLSDPDRYVYSPLPRRPRLVWPNGARLAFFVVVNLEVYELDPPIGPVRRPWPRVHPDVLAYSYRDYGNRVGLRRVVDVLDGAGLRGTLSLNVAALDHFPDLIQGCVARGWEVASHGVYNSRYILGLGENDERELILDCRDSIAAAVGARPAGWMGPSLTATERTFDLIAECGFRYTLDLFHDEQPFPVKVRSGRLVSVPYSVDLNDVPVFARDTPEAFAQMICDHFDVLYEDSRDTGLVMCIAFHPFLVGRPYAVRALEQALRYVVGHDDVWRPTGAEIADWYYEHYYDGAVRDAGRDLVGT